MKKSLIISLLTLFVQTYSLSQNRNDLGFKQYQSGTLHLRDGSKIKGLVKITNNNKVKFKKEKKSKKKVYNEKGVKKIVFDNSEEYVYRVYPKKNVGKNILLIVKREVVGDIELFSKEYKSGGVGISNANGVMITQNNNVGYFNIYFVSRKESILLKRFNHKAKKNVAILKSVGYDCPDFLKKINDKESYKANFNSSFTAAIKYYNESCNQK